MEIVRYLIEAAGGAEMPRIGVREADGTLRRVPTRTLAELLALPLAAFREALSSATEVEGERYRLLAPVDSLTEVWAAGVTYRRCADRALSQHIEGANRPPGRWSDGIRSSGHACHILEAWGFVLEIDWLGCAASFLETRRRVSRTRVAGTPSIRLC